MYAYEPSLPIRNLPYLLFSFPLRAFRSFWQCFKELRGLWPCVKSYVWSDLVCFVLFCFVLFCFF